MFTHNKSQAKIKHPLNKELYQYRLGKRFDPGAMAEAFDPLFSLPTILFRGAGRLAGVLNVFSHPQVWFRQQQGIQGVGGLQAGFLVSQPLIDPGQAEGTLGEGE